MIKQKIAYSIRDALIAVAPDHGLSGDQILQSIQYPQTEGHGDYASNIAMQLAGKAKVSPVELAKSIITGMQEQPSFSELFERAEVAEPGFINLTLSVSLLRQSISDINRAGDRFGQVSIGEKQKINLEFISANPTGELTIANGRGGFSGDALANVLSLAGHQVEREYYVNDVGRQAEILGESVVRRYLQAEGEKIDFPDYCYQGEYVKEIAKKFAKQLPEGRGKNLASLQEGATKFAIKEMVERIKKTVEGIGLGFDTWFLESDLYESEEVEAVLETVRGKDLAYEQEGATWFRSTKYGDDKDRVLVKADGEKTYFLSDIAYHRNKFDRGFTRAINILGADHHGYVPRIRGALTAFHPEWQIDFIVTQMVKVVENGKEMRMSKRSGQFILLEDLVKEVGLDVARFLFLMSSADTPLNFDLQVAKDTSEKNPVFYVQYAHARIASILRKAKVNESEISKANLSLIQSPTEMKLIKGLLRWPEVVAQVAESYQVQALPHYAIDLAERLHQFYRDNRVISDDKKLTLARLALIQATKQVIGNVLRVMGVSALERM